MFYNFDAIIIALELLAKIFTIARVLLGNLLHALPAPYNSAVTAR